MSQSPPRSIRLYDLVLENGCTIRPFEWRIKYAIAHKGFEIGSIPVGFTLTGSTVASIFAAASAATRDCIRSLREVTS